MALATYCLARKCGFPQFSVIYGHSSTIASENAISAEGLCHCLPALKNCLALFTCSTVKGVISSTEERDKQQNPPPRFLAILAAVVAAALALFVTAQVLANGGAILSNSFDLPEAGCPQAHCHLFLSQPMSSPLTGRYAGTEFVVESRNPLHGWTIPYH